MNYLIKFLLISLTLLIGIQKVCATDNPKALAAEIRAAIAAKDVNAASKLVEWGQAPVAAYRMFKMSIVDCFAPATCKVEISDMSEEEKKPQSDYYFPHIPEGKLRIIPPEGGEGLGMPFSKINGQYKIVIGQQTEKALAEQKASIDSRKIAQELDPDLLTSGKPLPADGGEPLKTYREYLAAISKGDTAYLAQNGTASDRYYFGNAYKDNPLKAGITLELVRMESINEPRIKAGFIKDSRAMLLVSGVSGQGWTTEGAVTLTLNSGKWSIEDKSYLGYPAH